MNNGFRQLFRFSTNPNCLIAECKAGIYRSCHQGYEERSSHCFSCFRRNGIPYILSCLCIAADCIIRFSDRTVFYHPIALCHSYQGADWFNNVDPKTPRPRFRTAFRLHTGRVHLIERPGKRQGVSPYVLLAADHSRKRTITWSHSPCYGLG